jgi:S-adenosylmethionine-diacylgycerolhomoserine-N-methlytransferase
MMINQSEAMDRMYRFTRHIYDFTRKYYLLGRDRLLDEMEIQPGDCVLEIGCGTARNLIKLARRHPRGLFYGLDASRQMLDTANKKIVSVGFKGRIQLKPILAEELDAQRQLGTEEPLDIIFFSYSLSMIPTWRQAIDAALRNLKSGGQLWIVDFWDQKDFPCMVRRLLQGWLSLFGVYHRPELLGYLKELEKEGRGRLNIHSIKKRYAFIGRFEKL